MKKKGLKYLIQGGIIAALYAGLTLLFQPISYGLGQVRISEALTILPFFTPAAVPGLFTGCVIANFFGGFGWVDVVFGSLATLLAAYVTYKIKNKWLAPLPSVLFNGMIVGIELAVLLNQPWWLAILYVTAGQAISCYVLGLPLLLALEKHQLKIFGETGR